MAISTLVASILLLVTLFSSSVEDRGGRPGRAPGIPAMVLEIQRTDITDAKPYKIFIRLESDEDPVQPEVLP